MRASKLLLPLVAVAFAPLFVQACATGQTEIFGGAGEGGGTTASTTSASSGSGGGASSSSSSGAGGSEGPCQTAADCAAFTDACNTGACINGACGQLAANDYAPCDDGKFCTDNTACLEGVCTGGTTKTCPSSGPCSIGACDLVSDSCVDVPGNDGASCVDSDPCTLTSSCSEGVCTPGQLQDCSYLDGVCSIGSCDPQLGCVIQPVNDGTGCDDGLYCTINDACKAGLCGGVPNTCAPPGNTCLIGTCNEAQDTCTSIPGNNGLACDDANDCTSGSMCSNGNCLGGVPANNGVLCDDGDGCSLGSTCANGVCGNSNGQVVNCVNGDGCCPAGCANNADDDCMDLSGVFSQYASENRNVYIWKTPPCADLSQYTTFCQDHGLAWWSAKSQPDAQQLITHAYNLDQYHTWIQVYQSTTTDVNGMVGGYAVTVDGVGCVEGSSTGWTAFRKWACSFCDPESNAQQQDDNQSCCWDKSHTYDWFVCED
jgi:hypothetical protein